MTIFFSALLGAVLAFIGAGLLRWWQYHRDAWLAQIDRFCSCIDDQADLCTDYWLMDEKHRNAEVVAQEARISGLQARIDGYWEILAERLPEVHRKRVETKLADLTDASTGGDFQVNERPADPERALLVQSHASDINVALRRAAVSAISPKGTLTYLWERSRQLQPPDDYRPLAELDWSPSGPAESNLGAAAATPYAKAMSTDHSALS